MEREIRMDNIVINIDPLYNCVLGDTFTLNGVINTNLTLYKIRCSISDKEGHEIKLATSNSGGSDSEIEIINTSTGEFIIICAKDLTTGFNNNITIAIEIENSAGAVRTIFQEDKYFENDNLTWTDSST